MDWSFNQFNFGGDAASTLNFDELRIGTTYADVVPTASAAPASAANSTVAAAPTSQRADGLSTSIITVTLKDAGSAAVPGKIVTLASNRGATDTISAASGPSDASGVVTFTVKSSTVGAPVFTATDVTDSSLVITQTATVTFTATGGPNANLISVDFVYSDLAVNKPYSGDTTLTGTLNKNSVNQIYTGQVGAWNALNVGANNAGSKTTASVINMHTGAGGATTVSFSLAQSTTLGAAGGNWHNNYVATSGGNLREEQAYLYYPAVTGNHYNWELAGLTANAHYRLTLFGSGGASYTNIANTVAGVLDTEGDWNWADIVADANGRITGNLLTTGNNEVQGLYGLQIEGTMPVYVAPATKLVYNPAAPTTGVAGTPFSVTVQSQDASGNPTNVTSNTTVTLTKATGAGTLSGTLTGTIASGSNSVTIATPFYSKSDTMTLTASATAGMTLTPITSGNMVFSAGAATKLAFTTSPGGTLTGGIAFGTQPVVTVQDAGGNTVTTDTSTVTVAIGTNAGPGGVLSGTPTKAASSGVASFSANALAIDKSGTGYTLTATDGSLTGATSATFNITVGAAAKLAFTTQPGGGSAGAAWATQPVVTVQDASGNTVTTDTSTVTVAIGTNAGPGGVLSGTLTKSASSGVASFSANALAIDKSGTGYTLTATDGSANERDQLHLQHH